MSLSLLERIHALPKELREEIFEYWLMPQHHSRIVAGYQPPPQLQIDQKSREWFAYHYYQIVVFPGIMARDDAKPEFRVSWLASITRAHREFIRSIELDTTDHYNALSRRMVKDSRDIGMMEAAFIEVGMNSARVNSQILVPMLKKVNMSNCNVTIGMSADLHKAPMRVI